ncbi:hypothetical protein SAY87_007088 [Trapa incisa]|uniref:ribonuclease P n=1 Tax=Trapa incisa TaxID=236973 RepID=A0AAN7PZX8_9MYRT|nr:hypothetical protein SAY87_007088 [Trapa incisa]
MAPSSSIIFTSLQQGQTVLPFYCKYLPSFEFHFSTHSLSFSRTQKSLRRPLVVTSLSKLSTTDSGAAKSKTLPTLRKYGPGSRSLDPRNDSLEKEPLKNLVSSLVKEKNRDGSSHNGSLRSSNDANRNKDVSFRKRREKGPAGSDSRPKGEGQVPKLLDKDSSGKKSKKDSKLELPDVRLRVALDQCSKRGDFKGAIELYDSARREGIRLVQYHYTVLLYLCSSAAVGVVQPAKSGKGARVLNSFGLPPEDSSDDETTSSIELGDISDVDSSNGEIVDTMKVEQVIHLSDDLREYALKRGFEIYELMLSENVPVNEAVLTSVGRMAMSMEDGDRAFDIVKQMKSLGIKPRLRSYGPALSVFCNTGNVQKAFEVENHMLENGVYPEEPELEALLRVSIGAGKGEKVYYVLHKLRASVRKVSPSTAELIERWFKSSVASKIGKRKWDQKVIREAIRNGGGGWHGQGWLGRGRWNVSHASVKGDGSCNCCGEQLALIDLEPEETENFALSVAAIAIKRERNSSFQKFQKWLEYYGPYEAVIDGANVGLFSQQRFVPSKVNAVVNGIRQKLPSKRWPLIVLHNRRITSPKMDEPVNKKLIEKWRNADALYATPTGSNDDWYWLYAAIKNKCLVVTNDEMRDHTFQLLGNDFFPKWKERHQVRFTFSDGGPEFHMPPPCSIVIQESDKGHWHIPIVSEEGPEAERTWLCVTRAGSMALEAGKATEARVDLKVEPTNKATDENSKCSHVETFESLRSFFSASVSSRCSSILAELEAAENLSNSFPIDFQI